MSDYLRRLRSLIEPERTEERPGPAQDGVGNQELLRRMRGMLPAGSDPVLNMRTDPEDPVSTTIIAIQLLAKDVVHRVESDSQRYSRYPRNCTIQYSLAGWSSHQSRSVRIAFPPSCLSTSAKIAALSRQVPEAVERKEKGRLGRLGLCATDFVVRAKGQQGMEAFLRKSTSTTSTSKSSGDSVEDAKVALTDSLEVPARVSLDRSGTTNRGQDQRRPSLPQKDAVSSSDADLALARKLQASYDRENAAWQRLDQLQFEFHLRY